MSSIDVTDWYQNGMSNTCKQYLNDVGFIIQGLKADTLKISFKKKSGLNINIDADNISQFIGISAGVQWEIVDNTTIIITTPKYVGYQLGRLRLTDEGRTLYRAVSVKDDKYLFESISVFEDPAEVVSAQKSNVKPAQMIDKNAVYLD
jgi:hypothetical protein